MNTRLVLLAALLSTCSDSRETSDDRVQKIYASAGEAVFLPCQINVTDNPTVEWSTGDLVQKIYTFVYKDYCEVFAMKNEDFQFRTSLFLNQVQYGNISLRISNVRPSDAGKHKCSILNGAQPEVITTLELIVCAAPEPKLSVVPSDVESVQCEVNSSLTHLIMTFLDHQGKIINAEEPKRDPDSSGCFTFRGRVKVPTASDRITCRVHQPQTNQSRDAQIYFAAKATKSGPVWFYVVDAFAVGIGVGFLLGYFWNKICSCCAGRKTPPQSNQPSVQSPDDQDIRSSLLLNQTDSEFLRKIEELDLQLQEKDRIISELREELEHIRSTQSPVAHQPDQPAFDVSPFQPSPDISNFFNPHQFPNGNNPKPGASSNSNHSNSGSLSQEKGTNPGVWKQTAVPDRPMRRRRFISHPQYHGPVSSDPSQDPFSDLADLAEDST